VVTRKGQILALAALTALALSAGRHFWRVPRLPAPSSAQLPASARTLLPPFRKENLELTAEPHQELNYRIGMQAGATLVYAWSTGHGEVLSSECPSQNPGDSAGGHAAFEARSTGWYRWRWKNSSDKPIAVQLKLNGYYEAASMPYDR
jgi:hypothetical protein